MKFNEQFINSRFFSSRTRRFSFKSYIFFLILKSCRQTKKSYFTSFWKPQKSFAKNSGHVLLSQNNFSLATQQLFFLTSSPFSSFYSNESTMMIKRWWISEQFSSHLSNKKNYLGKGITNSVKLKNILLTSNVQ